MEAFSVYSKALRYVALQIHGFELGPKHLRYADFDQKPCRCTDFTRVFANFKTFKWDLQVPFATLDKKCMAIKFVVKLETRPRLT